MATVYDPERGMVDLAPDVTSEEYWNWRQMAAGTVEALGNVGGYAAAPYTAGASIPIGGALGSYYGQQIREPGKAPNMGETAWDALVNMLPGGKTLWADMLRQGGAAVADVPARQMLRGAAPEEVDWSPTLPGLTGALLGTAGIRGAMEFPAAVERYKQGGYGRLSEETGAVGPQKPKVEVTEVPDGDAAYQPLSDRVMLDRKAIADMTPEARAYVVRHELAHQVETQQELWQKTDTALWDLWEKDRRHPIWDLMAERTGRSRFDNNVAPEIVAELYARDYPKGTFTVTARPYPYAHEGENLKLPQEYPIPPQIMEVLDQIEAKLGIWGKKAQRGTAPPKPPVEPSSAVVYHGATQPFELSSIRTPAFFSDNPETARGFAERRAAGAGEENPVPRVEAAVVNFKSPKVIDAEGDYAGNLQFGPKAKEYREALDDPAFDGVIIRNTADEGTVYVVKDVAALRSQPRPPVEPWQMRREEFETVNPHDLSKGSNPTERGRKFDLLPDDASVWVFHATDDATADAMLSGGVAQQGKPWTLASENYAKGDYATFSPGRGLGRGLYVGSSPVSVEGFGKRILAIKVPKSRIAPSPEAETLGNLTTGGALAVNDGMILGDIAPTDIVEMSGKGQDRYVPAHEGFVRRALAAGKPVPPEVLDDYPDLSPQPTTPPPIPAPDAPTRKGRRR